MNTPWISVVLQRIEESLISKELEMIIKIQRETQNTSSLTTRQVRLQIAVPGFRKRKISQIFPGLSLREEYSNI